LRFSKQVTKRKKKSFDFVFFFKQEKKHLNI
jgi:hypothetical protein